MNQYLPSVEAFRVALESREIEVMSFVEVCHMPVKLRALTHFSLSERGVLLLIRPHANNGLVVVVECSLQALQTVGLRIGTASEPNARCALR